MTIAELNTLIDGRITAVDAKLVALRAAFNTYLGGTWTPEGAALYVNDLNTAERIKATYTDLKTKMTAVGTEYAAADATYTAALADFAADVAAAAPAAHISENMTNLIAVKTRYTNAVALYARYETTAPAAALANLEAGYPDRLQGRYTH